MSAFSSQSRMEAACSRPCPGGRRSLLKNGPKALPVRCTQATPVSVAGRISVANSVAWEPAVISYGVPLSVSVMSTLELAQGNVPT